MQLNKRELMASRVAQELSHGDVVDLGIGIPTLVSNFIPKEKKVVFFAENGLIMMGGTPEKGKEDPDITDAGGDLCSILPGGSYISSADVFGLIRGGYCDVTVLGALEISSKGDLANWTIPGKYSPGMGGGMDLAAKSKKVIVITTHVNKKGQPKIIDECKLPLTAKKCVDLIVTDMAVIKVEEDGLVLKEIAESLTVEDVINATGTKLIIPDSVGVLKGL
jgi:acetate CoA/acetoacetate CoA-transferase beta subunit